MDDEIRVLELFSGIGGMRLAYSLALKSMKDDREIVSAAAIDLSSVCNSIYNQSFSGCGATSKNIASLDVSWFNNVRANVWMMSPPCQPFTRQGNQLDDEDNRSSALGNMIHIIKDEATTMPEMIVVENVKGFEESKSFKNLKDALESRKFQCYGYLLNSLDYGFPNSRLRFFLVALKCPNGLEISPFQLFTAVGCPLGSPGTCHFQPLPISVFMDESVSAESLVPLSVLEKPSSKCFDIVAPQSTQSTCFTRAYKKYMNGTGSVLLISDGVECEFDDKQRPRFSSDLEMTSLAGKLRYFTPLEIARLQGIHETNANGILCGNHNWSQTGGTEEVNFTNVNSAASYKVLGNSLNPRILALAINDAVRLMQVKNSNEGIKGGRQDN